jgi:hypothetical protein
VRLTDRLPLAVRPICKNCRFRTIAESVDRRAMYSQCHVGPPIMLAENDTQLRTWFPIVTDFMFCNKFRFGGWQRSVIIGAKCAIGFAIVSYFANHIAWADIAAAIWIP